MRLRWLWGDYIEPGIELTAGDRKRIGARLQANAGTLPYFWLIIAGMIVFCGLILKLLAQPLGRFIGQLMNPTPNAAPGAAAHLIASVAVAVPCTVACIFILGRLYVPIGRRSMCECGVRVCLRCGYDLRGAGEGESTCPECGRSASVIPIIDGDESASD